MTKSVIAVFARVPTLGKVKTRLARTHSEEFALELATAMLKDTLATCAYVPLIGDKIETRLFLTPDGFDSSSLWTGQSHPQGEGDLWARLLRADALLREEGFEKVVIVGSDAPDLAPLILRGAFHFLGTRSFIVGPSSDGGFYLLGASRPLPSELFEGVPISSRETLAALKVNLRRLQSEQGLKFSGSPEWRDVDDEDDLKLFIERLRGRESAAQSCSEVLKKYGLF